ncbi:MAG: hypothetical protein ACI86C_000988 [Candidatus Latescibacterota bacterium]|jgi:hypothetical protein
MKKTLQIANGIAFIATIVVNYLSNTGMINNATIGGISDNLLTLFTPAGYAFSIWGLIYLLLLGFIFYQGRSLFVKVRDDAFIMKTGWWFVISCIANTAWVLCWLYGHIGLSLVCMFIILIALLKIVVANSMELWDAPITVIVFLWWPFVIYSGWITVASIANVSAFLVDIGWNGFGLPEVLWTVIMIIIATVINFVITWKRNMREFALVGAWALSAIAVANWELHQNISYLALCCAAILFMSSTYHSFKNRTTSPFIKLNQYLQR